MPDNDSFSVGIVGAGTAGLAAAIALARDGHRVTVFEKHAAMAPLGAGVLIQMPHKFFAEACKSSRITLPAPGQYGAGLIFLPRNPTLRRKIEERFEQVVQSEGQIFLGWRTVPTNSSSLGDTARSCEPFMRQAFIGRNPNLTDDLAFERKLYVIRKRSYTEIRTSTLAGALVAVAELGRDDQEAGTAHLHAGQALLPPGDEAVQREGRRLSALNGTVEDHTIEQRAVIMNGHSVSRRGGNFARATLQDFVLQP